MALLSSRKTAALLGVHPNTLRNWAKAGKIKHEITPTGQRRYEPSTLLSGGVENLCSDRICYCRVSSKKQKDDLHRQVAELHRLFPDYEIVTDIGSGLSFKRKGFQTLLERVMSGTVKEIVVAHKDRLCRFGFDLVQWIVEKHGGKLMVLNDTSTSPQSELVSDILSILHVFSCRMHGLRKYSNRIKEDKDISGQNTEGDTEEDVGDISLHL